MRKPAPLVRGSRVVVVALASPPDPVRLRRGVRHLERLGLEVELAESVRSVRVRGDLAAHDAERAADLVAAFEDDDVDGIICSNGGFGTLRLLPLVDWDRLAAHPKPFVGYSDITALHGALNAAGLITFHGPMATPEPKEGLDDRWTRERFWRALSSPRKMGRLRGPAEGQIVQTVSPGRGSGPLCGGNLTLVAATMGTPWEIDTRGRVLVLEDWNEPAFTIETLLLQLRLGGKLEEAAGIVLGEFPNVTDKEPGPRRGVREVVLDVLEDQGVPAVFGLAAGHARAMHTLPLGARATVDADARTVTVDEGAVAAPGAGTAALAAEEEESDVR